MDADQQFYLAWARFNALRIHPPTKWDDAAVQDFTGALDALEAAYPGDDLSTFRVPADEPKPRVTSVYSRPGQPAMRSYTKTRFCDPERMRRAFHRFRVSIFSKQVVGRVFLPNVTH